ncbi:MAG: hypothetical protein L0Y66_06120 [Myxococcaceae bacterium]|nr:hypothetical protein [Myxococcaceae bacterium]MCI0669258.1 hypothetical protein [Myxococcaceae bacterium]
MGRVLETHIRLLTLSLVLGCDGSWTDGVTITRMFPPRGPDAPQLEGCLAASPVAVPSGASDLVVVASTKGEVVFLQPDTGREVSRVVLPVEAGRSVEVLGTPVAVDRRLVVAYQVVSEGESSVRLAHRVAVIDTDARALDARFPVVELHARRPTSDGMGMVDFLPSHAASRAALAHARRQPGTLGFVYVSFGNLKDIQPWHGWVFELNLDAWQEAGVAAAVSGVLLTTPENDCRPEGGSGAREMSCGGGVWAPAGPLVVPTPAGFELIVPTGNGQLDIPRGDFANTLMRVGPGLAFESGCDVAACAEFDVSAPAEDCVASCPNLFVPRLLPEEPPLRPETGVCDGRSFLECYAALDYDLGANTPARVEVPGAGAALVLPAKDGAVYLLDAEHLGTLHDRMQVVEPCGTATEACRADWAGMMVTDPAVTTVGGTPVAIVPTFMFDASHPAGIVALDVVLEQGRPRLRKRWESPSFSSGEARTRFREHPGRPIIHDIGGKPHAVVVEVDRRAGARGTLHVVRVEDGRQVAQVKLEGAGRRFSRPLLHGGALFVASCSSDTGPSHLEAFRIE